MSTMTLENLEFSPNTSYIVGSRSAGGKTRATLKALSKLALSLSETETPKSILFVSDELFPNAVGNVFKEALQEQGKEMKDLKYPVNFTIRDTFNSKEDIFLMLDANSRAREKDSKLNPTKQKPFDLLVLDTHTRNTVLSEEEIVEVRTRYNIDIITLVQTRNNIVEYIKEFKISEGDVRHVSEHIAYR